MKRLNIMFLIIGVAIVFSGCAKDDFTTPGLDQNDLVTGQKKGFVNSAATNKVQFSGECIFDEDGEPGTAKILPNGKTLVKGFTTIWHDYADDWRVTGRTIWHVNQKIEEDGTFYYWGKAELIVDGIKEGDAPRGKWQMTWRGYLNADGLVAEAVGQGKEGEVKGMVAKWVYTMDFDTFSYNFEGYYK